MRSIGKRNITKLKKIVAEEYASRDLWGNGPTASAGHWQEMRRRIDARIPEDWEDIWESAWSEIDRLISDEINQLTYRSL